MTGGRLEGLVPVWPLLLAAWLTHDALIPFSFLLRKMRKGMEGGVGRKAKKRIKKRRKKGERWEERERGKKGRKKQLPRQLLSA